ncbi:ankyrin repeat domain-containing protein [Massilia sp. GCM10020059]|uniref:Ankyrin repeat domain-containing protein n=1 Tax=Massilia agrisoli TaxID=2892444 RepID=A0ABS8IQA0_9BURK|nr:ankyrin repeat domain-containing protein [Massilia agrisoli]MCC6070784.1 ankyrin repeat domain-containing protein [Massilia agrisoli]
MFFLTLCLGMARGASADDLTDFFRVVQVDNANAVKSLIDKGVDVNARDPRSGETALIIALREDSMNVFKVLVADPRVETELAAPNGNTALMMAAFKRNKPAALALLERGAAVNRKGWSPLHYAAAGGADDIARILIDRGAAINARAPGGLTPLMMAAREGQDSAVAVLLEAGADTSLKGDDGLSAAQLAERMDKPRIAKAINTRRKQGRRAP